MKVLHDLFKLTTADEILDVAAMRVATGDGGHPHDPPAKTIFS
jgi:hypothetical protein